MDIRPVVKNPIKPWQVFVFNVNLPSGVQIVPNGQNVITNAPDFLDGNNNWSPTLRDTYVNNHLLTTAEKTARETYKTLLTKAEPTEVEPLTESSYRFYKTKNLTDKNKLRQQLGADFAVAYDPNADLYYFLNIYCEKQTDGALQYKGEVSIFFTCGVKFRTNTKNHLIRGHIDRYNTNLTPKSWETFDTPEPELVADTNIQDKVKAINYNDFTGYKWLLVNVKLDWFTNQDFENEYYDKDPIENPSALKELSPGDYVAINGNNSFPSFTGNEEPSTSLRNNQTPYYTLIYPIAPKGRKPNLFCNFNDWTYTKTENTIRRITYFRTLSYIVRRGSGTRYNLPEETVSKSVYDSVDTKGTFVDGARVYTVESKRTVGADILTSYTISWTKNNVDRSLKWELPPWLTNNNDKILSINYLDHLPFDITSLFNLAKNSVFDDFKNKNNSRIAINNAPFASFATNNTLAGKNVGVYFANHNAKGHDTGNPYGALYILNIDGFGELNYDYSTFTEKVFNLQASDVQLNQNKDINKEPKLFTPDFYEVKLINSAGDSFDFNYLRLLDSNKRIRVKSFNYLDPGNSSIDYWIEEDKINNLIERRVLNYTNNSSIPTKQDQYARFIRENTNRLEVEKKFNLVNEKLVGTENKYALKKANANFGLSLAGGVASILTGNFYGLAGSVAGAVSSAIERDRLRESNPLREKLSQRPNQIIQGQIRDVNNQLPSISTGNGLIPNLLLFSGGDIHLLFKKPSDIVRNSIFEALYEKGYNLNRLVDLNEASRSRYYFNFVQASNVFNTVEPAVDGYRFSSLQKQFLGASFLNGITFWHYRGQATWDGFLSYSFENWERSILKALNKV